MLESLQRKLQENAQYWLSGRKPLSPHTANLNEQIGNYNLK